MECCSKFQNNKIIRQIKLIYTLLIFCRFMCCIQHFTIYLLSWQNMQFFGRRRASYVILLIYMLDWNSLVYMSLLDDISKFSEWKQGDVIKRRLLRMHIPTYIINENAIFLWIHVTVTLLLTFFGVWWLSHFLNQISWKNKNSFK